MRCNKFGRAAAIVAAVVVSAILTAASDVWAASPYDTPYAVQWSFMIGNDRADNPNMVVVSPDESVWIGTGGTGKTSSGSAALTWGNAGSSYGGHWASGYGQISPYGMIYQGNDWPLVPGIPGGAVAYNQGYSSTIAFAGDDPAPYISVKPGRAVQWADAVPADAVGAKMHPMTMKITPLSTPYDYDGNSGGNLPIPNAAGIDVTKKFTHDLVNPTAYQGSAHDMVMGADGSYYFVAATQGSDPLNPPDTYTVGDFSGPYSMSYAPTVGKVSADGITYSGPAHQPSCTGRAYFTDVDINETAGKVYAAGYGWTRSGGTMDSFDPDGPGPLPAVAFDPLTPDSHKGYAVVYDSTTWGIQKVVTWESTQGGEGIYDITATPDGGFVIVGATKGDMGGNANPTPGTSDGYMEKYKADGTLDWNYQTETTYYDMFGDVTLDDEGNIYVSGNRDVTGSDPDPFLMKVTSAGGPVWTSAIDNGGTSESQRDHGNTGKEKIYVLSEAKPYSANGTDPLNVIGTPWKNTISYAQQGKDEVLLQKLTPGDFDDGAGGGPDGFVNWDDVTFVQNALAGGDLIGDTTYDFNEDGDSTSADVAFFMEDIFDSQFGDFNWDGKVDQDDLTLLLVNWGQARPAEWDGFSGPATPDVVDQEELTLLLVNWGYGTTPPPLSAVPEPSTLVLLVFGGLCLAMIRRRR